MTFAAVERVDQGDGGNQRGEFILVVVLADVLPGLVSDTARRVGDARALFGELQRGLAGCP